MRFIKGICCVGLMGVGAFAASIELSGTVKDGSGAAIAGALVTLASNPLLKDSTDGSGVFTISDGTDVSTGGVSRTFSATTMHVRGNELLLNLASSVGKGTISIYSGNGARCAILPLGGREPGAHRLKLPALVPGIYVVRSTIDGAEAAFKLVTTADGHVNSGIVSVTNSSSGFLRSAAVGADTLVVQKTGYATAKKEVASLVLSGIAIVLEKESAKPTLPPITDYSSKGPFEVVEEKAGANSKYVIFRPKALGENGFLHAPIIFGPGIGQTVVPIHRTMLTNFASHGFVVVGTPVLSQGPGGAQNLQTMKDALTWIVQQNSAEGVFKGKLWVDHAVSMGFSVGGTSAVQLGGESAIFTVVSIHGHTAEAALHGPMLQTTGTQDGVGMPLQKATYDKSKVQTFMGTLTNAPHGYIESNGGGEERKAIVAWMRYWIYSDTGARNFFFGDDCVLCKAPWEKPQRKNWVE